MTIKVESVFSIYKKYLHRESIRTLISTYRFLNRRAHLTYVRTVIPLILLFYCKDTRLRLI